MTFANPGVHSYLLNGGKLAELRPFTAVFNPSGIAHSTLIGPAGASFFTIELRHEHLRQLDVRLPRQTTFDRGAGAMLWPGLRLYSAFKAQTADALVLEGYVLEMVGAIADFQAPERTAPWWLGRVKERLHEEFRDELRMRELASEAGLVQADDQKGTDTLLSQWMSLSPAVQDQMRDNATQCFLKRFDIRHTATSFLSIVDQLS